MTRKRRADYGSRNRLCEAHFVVDSCSWLATAGARAARSFVGEHWQSRRCDHRRVGRGYPGRVANAKSDARTARVRKTLQERIERRDAMRTMYFHERLTMAQIGAHFGLSRARVSAIINKAPAPYGRLRENEDDPGDTSPGSCRSLWKVGVTARTFCIKLLKVPGRYRCRLSRDVM